MDTNISDNAIDSCETSTAVPAEPQECSSSTETKKLPTVRLDNSDYRNYWGVSPDYIIDLPDADSFKTAIEKLRLPEIVCGEAYECVIKLFTYNNTFKDHIQLKSVSVKDNPDFFVETNELHSTIHIKGTAKDDGALNICLEYNTKNINTSLVKTIIINPEPLAVRNQELQRLLQSGKFSPSPASGVAGEHYESELDISEKISEFGDSIKIDSLGIDTSKGLSATLKDNGVFLISGTPKSPGALSIALNYSLKLVNGIRKYVVDIPYTMIAPEPIFAKWDEFTQQIKKHNPLRKMEGTDVSFEIKLPDSYSSDWVKIENMVASDEQLNASFDENTRSICIKGIPKAAGTINLTLSVKLKTRSQGDVCEKVDFPVLVATPDPKNLWLNLPTDPTAPYQSQDEENVIIKAGERTIVAASKRGRSHAHTGKFRDDNFKVDYIEETGWFIIVVSDGAGSARYSREGSRIACQTFWKFMHEKLADSAVNEKINAMTAEERETILKNTVQRAAYAGLEKIDAEAKKAEGNDPTVLRKDYNATFLGYVMKKFDDKWLVVSYGIGDGIIGLVDRQDNLTLLSEPDGGEFGGQTRFITMNEVWRDNPQNRAKAVNIDDFGIIMSMTDGISDPKFETDNNLKNPQLWLDLWNDIVNQVPLMDRSDETAQKLSDWLDFWSKGNHDDRTIVLVY